MIERPRYTDDLRLFYDSVRGISEELAGKYREKNDALICLDSWWATKALTYLIGYNPDTRATLDEVIILDHHENGSAPVPNIESITYINPSFQHGMHEKCQAEIMYGTLLHLLDKYSLDLDSRTWEYYNKLLALAVVADHCVFTPLSERAIRFVAHEYDLPRLGYDVANNNITKRTCAFSELGDFVNVLSIPLVMEKDSKNSSRVLSVLENRDLHLPYINKPRGDFEDLIKWNQKYDWVKSIFKFYDEKKKEVLSYGRNSFFTLNGDNYGYVCPRDNIVFVTNVESKFGNTIFINHLGSLYEGNIVVVETIHNGKISVSIRHQGQDDINVGMIVKDMLKDGVEGIKFFRGGGHSSAASVGFSSYDGDTYMPKEIIKRFGVEFIERVRYQREHGFPQKHLQRVSWMNVHDRILSKLEDVKRNQNYSRICVAADGDLDGMVSALFLQEIMERIPM